MISYTHKENKYLLNILAMQASAIGLLKEDERLEYEQGNLSRGIATVIRLVRVNPEGPRTNLPRPQWIPEFGYRDGPSIIGTALSAAAGPIAELFQRKVIVDRDERQRKMNYLSEHVARRSE